MINGARLLLLAAGNGKRAGGPKAWQNFEGKSLLEGHLAFFERLMGPGQATVSIQEQWMDRCRSLSPNTLYVPCDPEATPLASLQRLISSSPERRSFVLHVDMPVFDERIYESLWNASGDAVVPVFEGRRGHPVLLSVSAQNEIKRLDPATGRLDSWLRQTHAVEVPVGADDILRNMNGAPA